MTTPGKRSTVGGSRGFGDREMVRPPKLPGGRRPAYASQESPVFAPLAPAKDSRPRFLFSSPVNVPISVAFKSCSNNIEQFDVLLKSCYHCNKNFDEEDDIFMYSGLQFCSVECRANHMRIDEQEMQERENLTHVMRANHEGKKDVKVPFVIG